MRNLGLVGIRSPWGRYLQAYTDGELHASNEHRNEEETWFLFEVDGPPHTYALCNWRSGRFMSKRGECAPAVGTVVGPSEQWRIESGRSYGVANAVLFRCIADRTVLGTNGPGDDYEGCGGEVTSRDVWGPGGLNIPANDSMWGGWWVITPAAPPEPGKDFWNTVGGAIQGVANQISPADVASVVAVIAAA